MRRFERFEELVTAALDPTAPFPADNARACDAAGTEPEEARAEEARACVPDAGSVSRGHREEGEGVAVGGQRRGREGDDKREGVSDGDGGVEDAGGGREGEERADGGGALARGYPRIEVVLEETERLLRYFEAG